MNKDDKLFRVTRVFSKSYEVSKDGSEYHIRAADLDTAETVAGDLYGECHVQEETDPHILLRKKDW